MPIAARQAKCASGTQAAGLVPMARLLVSGVVAGALLRTAMGCTGDGERATDAAACVDANILASNYDQSCTLDIDCVPIEEGNTCSPCDLACVATGAINADAAAKYASDTANTLGVLGTGDARCACLTLNTGRDNVGPFCCSGVCQLGIPCSAPAAAAE
jgi:hypothetical protein